MSKLISTNPSRNYQEIGSVDISTEQDVKSQVDKARKASQAWREMGVSGRIKILRELVDKLADNKQKIAELEAIEMGMPIKEALEDADFAIDYLNSYLDNGEEYLLPVPTFENEKEIHQVYKEPYGVVACIVPWNFPFNNFVWQCGENLVAGNTVVFKHSEETPLCGQLLEEIITSVLPDGVFNEVYGDRSVGEMLIQQDVDLICFTGSSRAGIEIRKAAADRLIHSSLELGGSAPGIVFEDADIDKVLKTIYTVRFMNCGQMCDALKRLIVHESKLDQITSKLVELIKTKKVGDATDPNTDIGPLVAQRQLELLEEQIQDAMEKGAKIEVGGKRPNGLQGAFYEPTILTDVSKDMRVWKEEVFAPVLPIVSFSSEEEAIKIANDTKYGLGAYVFTNDPTRFDRVAYQLESGMVSQNNVSYINTCNPFTGFKMSGGGREHAQFGFDEVTRLKVVAKQK